MLSSERKLSLIAALVALSLLVVAPGCTGFFVNQPNSIAVTTAGGASTFSVPPSVQMKATATYTSSTKDVTKSATWGSSSACVTVSSTGLVVGAGAASNVTVTATLGGVSGSISGGSTGGTGSQTLTIGPANTTTFTHGTSQQFTATLNNVDVTGSATWTSSDTSVVTFSTTTIGFATFGATAGTATISASVLSGSTCASGSESITVQ